MCVCVCVFGAGGRAGGFGEVGGTCSKETGPSMLDNSRKMNIRHFKATVRLLESANSK